MRQGLDPGQLRAERARFLAAQAGWADQAKLLAELAERDERLDRAIADSEPIVLWFESDFYDILQQFPWTTDGLNRSERALLAARQDGARTPAEAFVVAQRQEERPFLGDAIAFDYLERLDRDDRDDRWLGGARAADWRYDPAGGTVV